MSGKNGSFATKSFLRATFALSALFSADLVLADTLDQIVVSASRSEESISRSGSSVSVVSNEAIEKHSSKGMADVLRGVAGVEVREAGGIGSTASVSIRGANPGQTLVLIDGIRIGDPSSTDGAVDFGNLAVTDVERIEVLRGPQSALYGSDAMGGVINIITRRGDGPPKYAASVEGGSYGTIHSRASVSGSADQLKYAFAIDGLHSDGFARYGYRINRPLTLADGVTPLPKLPWGDPTNRGGASGRISYRLSDSATFEFGLSGYGNAIRFDNSFAFVPTNVFNARNHSNATLLQGYGRLTSLAFDGALQNQFSVFGNLTDRTIAQTEGCFDLFFTAFDCRSGYRGSRRGAEYQGDLKLGLFGLVIFGARTETEFARTSQDPAPAGTFTAINAQQTINSAFAQHRVTLGERLDLSLGGRIDVVSGGPTFATWRATASYRLLETQTRLHASIGTGAKAPSLFQRFSQYGNPALIAEESLGGDAGIEQKLLDGRLVLDITAFSNRYKNLIGFDVVASCSPAQIFGCYYNVGRALTRGIEVSGDFVIVPDTWKARATYTYLQSTNLLTNAPLYQRPRNQAAASLVFTGLSNFEAEGRVTFVGPRLDFATPAVRLGSYAKWDLLASYKVDQRLTVFARLENLTNARYEEVYSFGVAGRSIFGGLRVNW